METADRRLRAFAGLLAVVDRLRAPDGCPWDREQDFSTMGRHLLEECYELCAALDREDEAEIRGELGDLLMNVLLTARIAEDEGRFSLAEVADEIHAKLVRRHPHVFGDARADDAATVLANWERIKKAERQEAGTDASVLAGVPVALPALLRAQRIGVKAAQAGFDWPDLAGPLAKCREEFAELEAELAREPRDTARLEHELGDLFFALVNVARKLGLDPEASLRKAIERFCRRFRHIEERLGPRLGEAGLEAMDALWDEAKAAEAPEKPGGGDAPAR